MTRAAARRVVSLLALIASVAGVAACRPPAPKVLGKTVESAHSWIAGLDLAAEQWTQGLLPAPLVRIAADDARRGLEAERARLGRRGDLMKDARVEEAVRALDAASLAASHLRTVQPERRAEMETAREELRDADRRLHAAAAR